VKCAALALALATIALPVQAQATRGEESRWDTFEIWGGYARGSPEAGFLGDTPGINFGLLALRWSRPLGAYTVSGGDARYELSFDLIPLARISTPLQSYQPCLGASACVLPAGPNGDQGYFPDGSPFGAGVNALGLTRRFARSQDLSLSQGTTLGALIFEEPVPTTNASALNFMIGVEAGVRLGNARRPGIVLAYRAVHLSNAGTRRENPGVFSHLVSIGLYRPPRASGAARE
jgi:hypothetical protein